MLLATRLIRLSLGLAALAAAGCDQAPRQAVSESPSPPTIPEGIIRHSGAMPSPYSGGTRVKTAQALAAGQWEGPEQMFRATCAGCHDPAIAVGPPLFGRNLGTPYIATITRRGRNGMPGFFPSEFTDAEVQTLAQWIDTQPAPATSPSPAAASPQPGGTP